MDESPREQASQFDASDYHLFIARSVLPMQVEFSFFGLNSPNSSRTFQARWWIQREEYKRFSECAVRSLSWEERLMFVADRNLSEGRKMTTILALRSQAGVDNRVSQGTSFTHLE
jgi:hypothetical protein